jgi:hypothetical protein
MYFGVCSDGRPLRYEETTRLLQVGSSPVTFAQVIQWDAAGLISWDSQPLREWALAQGQSAAAIQSPLRLLTRYSDAYALARTITALGKTVKAISYGLFSVFTIIGLMNVCSQSSGGASSASGVGAIGVSGASLLGPLVSIIGWPLVGFTIALPIYLLGVIVSAQGQVLKATLDTAVHTSPLLTPDEVSLVLSNN